MAAADEPQELVATLFARTLTPPSVQTFIDIIQTIQNPNATTVAIKHTFRLLSQSPPVLEITFEPSLPPTVFRNNPLLHDFEKAHSLQLVLQPAAVRRTRKRLAVFDMDSTLIQQEVIDLLAARANSKSDRDIGAAVAAITARAMNGELDFADSLRERVALLENLPAGVFEELKPSLTLTPGADTLLMCLQKLGVKTALLSGGFMPLATYIGSKLGIDHVYANELIIEDDQLIGKLDPKTAIVDSARKRALLLSISESMGLEKEEILSVGDGANDLPMLWAAGLGIAVNAKPKVQIDAPCRLNTDSLDNVLHLLGYTRDDIVAMSR